MQTIILNEKLHMLHRGLGVNGIDPGAFRGAFQAQQPVERTAECTPVSVQKFNSIVKFYQYGKFHQNLDAQQVAKLSAILHLRPLRPTLSQASPDKSSSSAPAQKTVAAIPPRAAVNEPSASCRVSHGLATDKLADGGAAASTENGEAVNGRSRAAPAAAAPAASKGAPQLSSDPKRVAAQACSNGAQQPLAFQLNGLKSMKAGPVNASKPGRRLSLASVLDDIFEEVRNTPRSSRRRRRRRDGEAQKGEVTAAPAAPAVLPMSPIAAAVPDSEHKSVPAPEQQALPAAEAPVPHQGIGLMSAAPASGSNAQPEVKQGSVAPVEVSAAQAAPPAPTSSQRQSAQVHAGLVPHNGSSQQQAGIAAPAPTLAAPALAAPAPTVPQPTDRAPEQAGAAQPTGPQPTDGAPEQSRAAQSRDAAAVAQSKVDVRDQQPKVLPLVPGSALICACSAQEADRAFNRHQLPLPQRLREAQPQAVIRQGMRVFLHNADTRRLLGPFYAQQTKASELEVACHCSYTVALLWGSHLSRVLTIRQNTCQGWLPRFTC